MKSAKTWLPFLLLILGTLGLLVNEFLVKAGSVFVIVSALFNIIGLFLLFIYPGYILKR